MPLDYSGAKILLVAVLDNFIFSIHTNMNDPEKLTETFICFMTNTLYPSWSLVINCGHRQHNYYSVDKMLHSV